MTHNHINHIISLLEGNWKGEGRGMFPTIPDFVYKEEIIFRGDPVRMLTHFEQKTWVRSEGERAFRAGHWESGFLYFDAELNGFLNSAQNSGRCELLKLESVQESKEGHELLFESQQIINDLRMMQSARVWRLNDVDKTFDYDMKMSTGKVRQITLHLQARLKKEV